MILVKRAFMEQGIYAYIWRYSRRDQIIASLITLASFPFLYWSLLLPKTIVNEGLRGTNFPKTYFGVSLDQQSYLLTLCAILFVLLIVNALFLMVVNTYKNLTSERMVRRLRFMLFQRVLRFPLPHFQRVSQGELSTMIAGEVELIREFISDAISLPVFQGGTLLVILFFMFSQDPILGAASIALIPFQAYIIPKMQRRINLLGKERVERARRLSGRVGESVSGIRDIRANNTATYVQADFSKHLEGIYRVRYELFRQKYMMKALNLFLLKLTPVLFYSVGGVLILQGRLSLGSLVAALAAYSQLTTPWKELLRFYQRWGDASIKYGQLVASFEPRHLLTESVLGGNADAKALASLPRMKGPLVFDHVMLRDEDGTRVADDVTFEVRQGGRLAVAASALTRERLAYAAAGLIQTDGGTVKIGGQPLDRMAPQMLGARISYVGADSYVFDGTVGYNSVFGLQLKAPPPGTGTSYDYKEALDSGNSLHDIEQDWTELGVAGLTSKEELHAWWYRVIKAVELDGVLFQRLVGMRLPRDAHPELESWVLTARARFQERLKSSPELAALVNPFDIDAFNPSLSIASNILFGEPVDECLAVSGFGSHAYVREVLDAANLSRDLELIGLRLTRQMRDLFGDPNADPRLIERFAFVDRRTLPGLYAIAAKVKEEDISALTNDERGRLVSLAAQLVVDRHRFGHIDEALQAKILKARQIFRDGAGQDIRRLVALCDPETYNPSMTLRANIVMGRVSLQKADAEKIVNRAIREELAGLGLLARMMSLAMLLEVGIGGQTLPVPTRQSLNMARSILKRPDVLIVNEALNAHDREARGRIRRQVLELLPEATLVWIESDQPEGTEFDELIVFKGARIDRRINPRELVPPASGIPAPAAAEDGETMVTLADEAQALGRLALFSEMRPANLKLLAFGSKRVVFAEREYLAQQGEPGETAYVILSGEIEVLRVEGSGEPLRLAVLGSGQLFGETALLATVPRVASGRALRKVEALEINKAVFLSVVEHDPKVAMAVARVASERLASVYKSMVKAA